MTSHASHLLSDRRIKYMTEAELQHAVINIARIYGWRAAHFRAARTDKGWRTPMQGDAGFPDTVLCRDGIVLLAELKNATGKPTADQRLWLHAAGTHARLWRPENLDAIITELHHPRGRSP